MNQAETLAREKKQLEEELKVYKAAKKTLEDQLHTT